MNIDVLKGYVPDQVIDELPTVMSKFEINTILRLSHFLGQCSHESMGFKVTHENLNYSAKSLKAVFPAYFPGDLGLSYERQPEKIGSRVYGSRMGNGNESTGEGYKFRGRGYIQLTGKNNYRAFGLTVDEDFVEDPELVASTYPLTSAGWFFKTSGINGICDRGYEDSVVASVTKRVNGGTIGLDDRIKQFNKFYDLLK